MVTRSRRRQSARLDPATAPPAQGPEPNGQQAREPQRARGSQRRRKIQRVDEISQFMAKKKIALGEFIQIYATAEGSGGLGGRPAKPVKRLADALRVHSHLNLLRQCR